MAPNMPSATSVLSAYTTFAASIMVVKTMLNEVRNNANQVIPQTLQEKIIVKFSQLFKIRFTEEEILTINISRQCDSLTKNEIYEAAHTYLGTKINHSNKRLKLSKAPRDKDLLVSIDKGEVILDSFEGITLRWVKLVSDELSQGHMGHKVNMLSMELNFNKQHKDKVLGRYIPFVLETAKKIQDETRVVKLYKIGDPFNDPSSIDLHHPSTFDTLAMEPEVKRALIDDLDKFVRRKEFYHRVGKVWKRGYLLHGPPGTGKSSLVAAMANYLKFHIYDFDLSRIKHDMDFRRLLVSTTNRSIIVIEDIDCSYTNFHNRHLSSGGNKDTKQTNEGSGGDHTLPLAGLLNFIDGLWSSCGDERIIVFTTNYKERLDPALIRPGRMDVHIHMSYLTFGGFKILSSNYLNISSHALFAQIEELLKDVQVTPAEAAQELMKSDDIDEVLEGFEQLLLKKEKGKQVQENL
ncbi:AAA-ATPase At3g50940-like [Chenopodium quinoa]|uniref:AAA+ ATPase domain-containing protein n=1 Tax=Chenopodium quinoa TaxID=63459 RepID=A0A803L1X3_CHEQI|nr:AAA-ATPase At3g50940-like [Chenopodium quinoa]